MSITLPRWLYDGIVQSGGVLTIHADYFVLTVGSSAGCTAWQKARGQAG